MADGVGMIGTSGARLWGCLGNVVCPGGYLRVFYGVPHNFFVAIWFDWTRPSRNIPLRPNAEAHHRIHKDFKPAPWASSPPTTSQLTDSLEEVSGFAREGEVGAESTGQPCRSGGRTGRDAKLEI